MTDRQNARVVEWLAIADLQPFAGNPHHHPRQQLEKLAKLVAKFGIVAPDPG